MSLPGSLKVSHCKRSDFQGEFGMRSPFFAEYYAVFVAFGHILCIRTACHTLEVCHQTACFATACRTRQATLGKKAAL